jgi:hypothetical protein
MHDILAEEFTVVPYNLPECFSVSKTVGSYSESFVYRYNYLYLKPSTVSPEIDSISGIKNKC